tara:strand:+ start:17 stop:529 length:513 start_codon:yes stop_codon:yes gene_type:complete
MEEKSNEGILPSKQTPLQWKSNDIGKLAQALAKAQAEMTGAIKDSKNPFFNSQYADLHSVIDASRPYLSKHGLSIAQIPGELSMVGSKTVVVSIATTLMHESGQWIQSIATVPLDSPVNAQKYGSALTYGRRYGLAAMVGIAQMDDDGNAAVKTAPQTKVKQGARVNGVQ